MFGYPLNASNGGVRNRDGRPLLVVQNSQACCKRYGMVVALPVAGGRQSDDSKQASTESIGGQGILEHLYIQTNLKGKPTSRGEGPMVG